MEHLLHSVPHRCKTRPLKKSIQIPTREAQEDKNPIFKMQRAVRNRPNVRFKIDIFKKKTMPTLPMTASSKYQ